MIITPHVTVLNSENICENFSIKIKSKYLKTDENFNFKEENLIAFPPFINSHDHLIGNWFPHAGDNAPYKNSHIWVEDMKNSPYYLERNKIWQYQGNFDLLNEEASTLVELGIYKNLFSGVGYVADHMPRQKSEYYQKYPITIFEEYRQAHSIKLGNWWGGSTIKKEWDATNSKIPFMIHLNEGIDLETRSEFKELEKMGMLDKNTLIIHAISLTDEQIKKCGNLGVNICWCPVSNHFLIGQTLDIESCFRHNVNVVIGTDSSFSGSINLFEELNFIKDNFPEISSKEIYKMITENPAKIFNITQPQITNSKNDSLLILKKKESEPFENIFHRNISDIEFFLFKEKPLFGKIKYLTPFDINKDEFHFFELDGDSYFVYGHPENCLEKIESKLGYRKIFPYLPFK